jgi:hypothetical protein
VPGLASFGDAREDVDTTELALGGGNCGLGGACKSGVPLAWKNFGCILSSPTVEPTAEALELCGGGGIDSPLA